MAKKWIKSSLGVYFTKDGWKNWVKLRELITESKIEYVYFLNHSFVFVL